MKNPYVRALFGVLALILFFVGMGAACDEDTEEAIGVRVNDERKVQLTTNGGWTDADKFTSQAIEDTGADLENIAEGIQDGVNAVAEQAKRYPSEENPLGATCAEPCNARYWRGVCKENGTKFNRCRCCCEEAQ